MIGFRFLKAYNSETQKNMEAQQTKLISEFFNEVMGND
jgi:hypothetical protein